MRRLPCIDRWAIKAKCGLFQGAMLVRILTMLDDTFGEFQSVILEAVEAMASARKEVEATISSVQSIAESLNWVTQAADEVAEMAKSTSAATVEQTQASEEVAHNLELIAQLIEGNLQTAQQANLDSNELLETLLGLKALIGGFQIHTR